MTFCEIPSSLRSSSLLRRGPCSSAGRISGTHLPEISSRARRDGQAASKTSPGDSGAAGVAVFMVTEKCVLVFR
ncbi:hypothetical protein D9M68_637960 [compost metagenome]